MDEVARRLPRRTLGPDRSRAMRGALLGAAEPALRRQPRTPSRWALGSAAVAVATTAAAMVLVLRGEPSPSVTNRVDEPTPGRAHAYAAAAPEIQRAAPPGAAPGVAWNTAANAAPNVAPDTATSAAPSAPQDAVSSASRGAATDPRVSTASRSPASAAQPAHTDPTSADRTALRAFARFTADDASPGTAAGARATPAAISPAATAGGATPAATPAGSSITPRVAATSPGAPTAPPHEAAPAEQTAGASNAPAPVPPGAVGGTAVDTEATAERAFRDGLQALLAGDAGAARAPLDRACAASSSSREDSCYWAAVAWLRSGDHAHARRGFADLLARWPSSTHAGEASVALGWLLLEIGDRAAAHVRFAAAATDPLPRVRADAQRGLAAAP